MNQNIGKYIKQVRTLLPIIGKPEKDYLNRLSADIEDRFADNEPQSVDEICQLVGTPQNAVKDYFASTDTSMIVRRVSRHKLLAVSAWIILTILFCSTLVVTIRFALRAHADQLIDGYVAPVYEVEQIDELQP